MATYRVVKCSIWGEEWFVEAPSDTKVLFMYLFQCHETAACGALKQAIRTVAATTNLAPDRVREILAELGDRVIYDADNGVIWVRYFYRHQASSPNFGKSAIASLADFPVWVRREFASTYPELFGKPREDRRNPIDTLSEPISNPIDTLSEPSQTTSDQIIADHSNSRAEEEPPKSPVPGDLAQLVTHRPADFVRLRGAYRNKNSPDLDAKAWDKLKPDDKAIAKMEEVIFAEEIAPDEIPHIQAFSVFLNQRTFFATVPFKGLGIYRDQRAKQNGSSSNGHKSTFSGPVFEPGTVIDDDFGED